MPKSQMRIVWEGKSLNTAYNAKVDQWHFYMYRVGIGNSDSLVFKPFVPCKNRKRERESKPYSENITTTV